MKGEWVPRDGSWWQQTEHTKGSHGVWGGRLPANSIPCMEKGGYSMWHLLAAKALPPQTAMDFLETASEAVDTNQLIDDLREKMTVFDDTWRKPWFEWSGLKTNRFGWKRLQRETAFCSPLEICERLRVPLIAFDLDADWPEIHPVIEAAQAESLRQLG